MVKNNQYGPDVYKRLELVTRQLQQNTAEKRKQQSAERKRIIADYFKQNTVLIARTAAYIILAALVVSIVWMLVIK